MSQPLYSEGILRIFGMADSKAAFTPMIESFFTGLEAENYTTLVAVTQYQSIIGCLLHISLRTRPDILTAVLILASFENSPTSYFHRAVNPILRYVPGTSDYCFN